MYRGMKACERRFKGMSRAGICFVTDEKGRKIAVQIDLKKYGELWEDFYDTMVAEQRAGEPRESLESVKKRLRRQGKLDA